MITTEVFDAGRGAPAARVPVELDIFISGHGWRETGHGLSNSDGHVLGFGEPPAAGVYRLTFDIAAYMPRAFFPSISVVFEVHNANEDCHLPLLLSPFSYTIHRG